METALKTDEVTTNSQLVGLLPGNPPKGKILLTTQLGRTGIKTPLSRSRFLFWTKTCLYVFSQKPA